MMVSRICFQRPGRPFLGQRRQRIGAAHDIHALLPHGVRALRRGGQGVAPHGGGQLGVVLQREGLAKHAADGKADKVHARDAQRFQHVGHVARQVARVDERAASRIITY